MKKHSRWLQESEVEHVDDDMDTNPTQEEDRAADRDRSEVMLDWAETGKTLTSLVQDDGLKTLCCSSATKWQ